MSVTSTAYQPYYSPVAAFQPGYLSRLALIGPFALIEPLASSFDWDRLLVRVPQVVSGGLSAIDGKVLSSHPAAIARSGKTLVRNESLFVYHTYSLPTNDEDAVVVGLTVERIGAHVILRGDIANEESGKVYSELAAQSLARDNKEVLEKVQKAAEELAGRSHIVIEAVVEL